MGLGQHPSLKMDMMMLSYCIFNHINGLLVQDCRNSCALAMELLQFCIKLSIYWGDILRFDIFCFFHDKKKITYQPHTVPMVLIPSIHLVHNSIFIDWNLSQSSMVAANMQQAWVINIGFHSVESPSMVDPQWNIWYWGSKWNLHTVCWWLKCGWLWVGHNLCLLWDYLCLLYP